MIPPSTSMEKAVTDKVEEFVKSGGHVIGAGVFPYECIDDDCQVQMRYAALFGMENRRVCEEYWKEKECEIKGMIENKTCAFLSTKGSLKDTDAAESVITWIRKTVKELVSIDSGKNREIYSSVRRQKDGSVTVFIGNHGRETAKVTVSGDKKWNMVRKINLEHGELEKLSLDQWHLEEESNTVSLVLDGCESCLLLWEETESDAEKQVKWKQEEKTPVIVLDVSKEMALTLQGQNVYRIDSFDMSLDQKEWKKTEVQIFSEACDAAKLLREEHLCFTGSFGIPKRIQIKYPIEAYYRTVVRIEDVPKTLSVLMDDRTISGSFIMHVNGHKICKGDFTPIFINDQNNRICPIVSYIKKGENQIDITVTVQKDFDGIRDPLYLLGDFGVEDGCIVSTPKVGKLGEGYIKGAPFYSGEMRFTTDFSYQGDKTGEIVIELGGISHFYECMEMKVNGHDLGARVFSPYRFRCRKEWLKKQNTVELSYRNTLIHMLEGSYFDYETHQTMKITP